jgi:hypothetical protein
MRIEPQPGESLDAAWVVLSPAEARDLLVALQSWAEDSDLPWHHHVTDGEREFTLAIEPEQSKTQPTQPKSIDPKTGKPYEPIEIPGPKESQIEGLLSCAANPGAPRKGAQS